MLMNNDHDERRSSEESRNNEMELTALNVCSTFVSSETMNADAIRRNCGKDDE